MQTITDTQSTSAVKRALRAVEGLQAKLAAVEYAKQEPIAIIGMGCRFPGGADSPDAYWNLLVNGVDAITEVPQDRWDLDTFYATDPEVPGKMYTRYGGFVENLREFDPQFFGISPKEAATLDPQQRLVLEVSWEALEHAGLAPDGLEGSQTGVFLGICSGDYQQQLMTRDPAAIDAYLGTGNAGSAASGRLAFLMGFTGPCMSIDTACSSSLVTIHQACQSLRNGESDLALAGGVNRILVPELSINFSKARMLAPDGRCKTFDASADGFTRAEGCGMIVLKRLSDVQADGDPILALIRGSAVNQDGRSSGLTVPNGPSQQQVIRQALASGGITPAQVSYVEAHGTGTSLGDPIEVRALGAVYGEDRPTDQPLTVGSVKTNIGHLEGAAGIAGLIKVVLSLQHEEIPPHLHFNEPSPHISWDQLPITVPTARTSWPRAEAPRLAGISSFGFSGTNVHAILEEAPVAIDSIEDKTLVEPVETNTTASRPQHLFTLSAKSQGALDQLTQRYITHLQANPHQRIEDVCFTANTGRSHFNHRLGTVAESVKSLIAKLANGRDLARGQVQSMTSPRVAFLFTGQGSQYVDMGRELYETEPIFRNTLDRCAEILADELEHPLLSVIFDDTSNLLAQTAYTQPALFAVEYALTELWKSWGIVPDVVMGHSVGEYVAACVAGVFSLEDGLKFITQRGRLMQALPQTGAMVAVQTTADGVAELLQPHADQVSIAAINGPENVVLSGDEKVMDALLSSLEAAGFKTTPLDVSHAFHSPLMAPMLPKFRVAAQATSFAKPQVSLISNLTGELVTDEMTSPEYWVRHVRHPVQFAAGMATLLDQQCDLMIEIGPKPVLLGMGRQCLPEEDIFTNIQWLPSLRTGQSDWLQMLSSLSACYVQGATVEWSGLEGSEPRARQRIPLPTYPFQRKPYWFNGGNMSQSGKVAEWQGGRVAEFQNGSTAGYQNGNAMGYQNGHGPQWSNGNGAGYQNGNMPQWSNGNAAGYQNGNGAGWPSGSTVGYQNGIVAESQPTTNNQQPTTNDQSQILESLRIMVAGLLHADPEDVDTHMPFLEMGADSLIIMDAIRNIQNEYGIKIAVRRLFEDLINLEALAEYISEEGIVDSGQLTVDSGQLIVDSGQSATNHQPLATNNQLPTTSYQLLAQQLQAASQAASPHAAQAISQVVAQQLAFLGNSGQPSASNPQPPATNNQLPTTSDQQLSTVATDAHFVNNSQLSTVNYQLSTTSARPLWKVSEIQARAFDPVQQQHLDALIKRYTARTQGSKESTQQYRPVLADNRASAGFRLSTKEMLYPIVGTRSQGSRIWDVDGNEYIDLTMGFGVNLFGHNPSFVVEALQKQVEAGFQMGPQAELAGATAQLISELTGMARVAFCNTGTEAVMTAMRLARAKTGRAKIAIFNRSYHGHFDGVLGEGHSNGQFSEIEPIAPGILPSMVQDLLVLDYDDPQSLVTIRQHAHELAAVMVEPVQSRQLQIQPRDFLHQLREVTQELDIALIFDEMITGFRIAAGGAQAYFGVEADIATYGKIVGGGLPIGVIAGKANYLDCLDGGAWHYGDGSFPQAETTFFAGTFGKNPMTIAASHAVLQHIKVSGEEVYAELQRKGDYLTSALNSYFTQHGDPIEVVNFGSLFRFSFKVNMDLLFFHLLDKGVYIWEGRNCFISTAHSDEDLDHIINVIQTSMDEMRAAGFLGKKGKKSAIMVQSEAPFPLTEAQEHLHLLNKISETGSQAYNLHTTLCLQGSLDMAAMNQAIQDVVARHGALRTIFNEDGTEQQIQPELNVALAQVDFSHLAGKKQRTQVEAWLAEEGERLFDLTTEPPIRLTLLSLATEPKVFAEYLLVITTHHILTDGISLAILIEDIAAAYSAACAGKPLGKAPAMQFPAYVAALEQGKDSEAMATQKAYWLEQLTAPLPVLELPTDRPRPPLKSFVGQRQTLHIDTALTQALRKTSQEQQATLFMNCLSAYTLLLHRITGQEDILVGIPTAGRAQDEMASLVGYCTHLLPIRSQLAGNPNFSDYLGQIKGRLFDAFEHADYPFARLLNGLELPRDASRAPLINTMFNLDRPMSLPDFGGLSVELHEQPIRFTPFDLTVNITELADTLVIDCDYNSDLFDAATVEGFLAQFHRLLQGVVANPEQAIAQLPLMDAATQEQMLVTWNQTDQPYPQDKSVQELFEEQAQRTPDAIALTVAGLQGGRVAGLQSGELLSEITYQELNERANQLAHHLQELGVTPGEETIVGLYLERSIETVIGMLGILKAGGAYLPLDPTYPAERLAFMVEDAKAALILSQSKLVAKDIPWEIWQPTTNNQSSNYQFTNPALTICLDSEWDKIAIQSTEDVQLCNSATLQPSPLAYIIYTSGSTGQPKGVEGVQQSILNRCHWMWETLPFGEDEVFVQKTALSFVDSIWEIFGPLLAGVPSVIVPDAMVKDTPRFIEALAEHEVTRLVLVPSLLRTLLDAYPDLAMRLPELHHWTSSGETLTTELCQRFYEQLPDRHLINLYGSSEVAGDVTWYDTLAGQKNGLHQERVNVPLGRPIANTQAYILGPNLEPLPPGAIGEIYIGGDCLARGYYNRPDLTEERFKVAELQGGKVAELQGGKAAELQSSNSLRLYRTGDLGRFLSDGNIEFVGRADHQIKLRGFRIELGEIESALSQHPNVNEAIVMVRADQGQENLVAYVTQATSDDPATLQPCNPANLRTFLETKLPAYMVPTHFVMLEQLPLTPNGKIDRSALPAPDGESLAHTEFVAPRSETEAQVADIWRELLHVEPIGVYDNFFDLGGQSLLATQVISRIRHTFGVEPSMSYLFEKPTVAGITEGIEQIRTTLARLEAPTMNGSSESHVEDEREEIEF